MDLGLADARVVVTGGASNIGRGIVHTFAAEGARIVISDIDGPQAEKVRAEALEMGATDVTVVVGDLTDPGAAEATVDAAQAAWGGLDVLVNNAGWSVPGFIATDTDRDKWQRTIEINLFTAREHGRHGIRSNVVCPGLVIPDGPEATGPQACGRSERTRLSIKSRSTSCSRTRHCEGSPPHAVVWFSSPQAARQVTGQLISLRLRRLHNAVTLGLVS